MPRHLYDATDNKWISVSDDAGCLPSLGKARATVSPVVRATPSSSMPEDARATGGLWQLPPSKKSTEPQVLRFPYSSASSARAVPCRFGTPARTLLDDVLDVVTTIAGLLLFGMLAMFFWILA